MAKIEPGLPVVRQWNYVLPYESHIRFVPKGYGFLAVLV